MTSTVINSATGGTGTPPGIPTSLGGTETPVDIGSITNTISGLGGGSATTTPKPSSGSTATDSSSSGPSSATQDKTPATYDPSGTPAPASSSGGETGGETAPPPPASDPNRRVVDLNDAGLVFGVLREGVDAWRASLGYATDSWGNQLSEGYVEARRPDFVCEGLRAFLKDYYKDNPSLYASLGPGDLPPPPAAPAADATPTTSSADATPPSSGPASDTQDKDAVATGDPSDPGTGADKSEDTPDLAKASSDEKDATSNTDPTSGPMAPSSSSPTASAKEGGETGQDT